MSEWSEAIERRAKARVELASTTADPPARVFRDEWEVEWQHTSDDRYVVWIMLPNQPPVSLSVQAALRLADKIRYEAERASIEITARIDRTFA